MRLRLKWTATPLPLQERLTDRPDDTPLHVIPIGQLNAKGLLAYLAKRRGPFDRVLGFRPTGWTHGSQGPCQVRGLFRSCQRGRVIFPSLGLTWTDVGRA